MLYVITGVLGYCFFRIPLVGEDEIIISAWGAFLGVDILDLRKSAISTLWFPSNHLDCVVWLLESPW